MLCCLARGGKQNIKLDFGANTSFHLLLAPRLTLRLDSVSPVFAMLYEIMPGVEGSECRV